jgi:hypothetical protein
VFVDELRVRTVAVGRHARHVYPDEPRRASDPAPAARRPGNGHPRKEPMTRKISLRMPGLASALLVLSAVSALAQNPVQLGNARPGTSAWFIA